MRKTLAIVFAGGRAEEMSVLTFRRPKSAVLFGGGYRMIDFALTNLANTKSVENVGILTQYRPSSLVEHVGIGLAWDFVGSHRSIRILPPHLKLSGSEWYRGTADALFQNMDFIDLHQPDDILIVSGDHAYNMSYEPLLRFHVEHNAELTMGVTPVDRNPSRFGIVEVNAEGRIISYMEKPKHPRTNLANMTAYVFKPEILVEELKRQAHSAESPQPFQMYDAIIPSLVARNRTYAWIHHGHWDYARTLDAYFQAHQDMLGESPPVDLERWKVRTNVWSLCSSFPGPARCGPGAAVSDSIVSGGCDIEGTVERSVLSPDVKVGKGAMVCNSVLWSGVVVEEGAVLDKVVCDKRCVIGKGAVVGYGKDSPANDDQPASLTCGATVLGMDVKVPPRARIGRNCIVYPGAEASELKKVPSGKTVRHPAP